MQSPLFLLCQTKVLSEMANFLIVMIANRDYGIFFSIQIAKALIQKVLLLRFGDFKIFNSYNWPNLPSEKLPLEKLTLLTVFFFSIIEKKNLVLVCLCTFI